MKNLLRVSEPFQHESIYSYLLRLTNLNFYPTPYWIYENVGLIRKEVKLVVPNSLSIENLHQLTNNDKNVLGKLTYFDDLKIFEEKSLEYSLVYHYALDGKYAKICPHCFCESPFQRKVWDYKTVIACPFHKCLLINKCNKCGKKIPHYRKDLLTCTCGASLFELPTIKASIDELYYASWIYEKLDFSGLPFLNPINKTSEFDKLQLYQILFISVSLLNRNYYSKEGSFLKLNYFTEDNNFRNYLSNIYSIFNNWPNGYYEYLKMYQSNANSNNNKSGISYDFSHFYIYLYKVLINKDYHFLRVGFESYIGDYWENGSLRSSSKYVTRKKSKYADSETVLREYGITKKTLNKLILDNKVKGRTINKAKVKTKQIVEETELINFINYMNQFITKNEAVSLLGVNHKNLNILINSGLVIEDEYLFKRLRKGSVKKSDIEEILQNFREFSKRTNGNIDLINTDSVLISLSSRFLTIVDLVKMVSKGLLTPYYEEEITLEIRRFFFDRTQLKKAKEYYLFNYCEFLTPKMIMQEYSIHETNVTFFIKEGIISSEIRGGFHFIKKDDFNKFMKKYVVQPELSKLIKKSNSIIHQYLLKENIFPVLSRENGRGTYLYFRKDIEDLVNRITQ